MNIEKIKKANTKIIGKKIEYFKEIASTHILAKKVAKSEIEENKGKILIAEKQTAGIGTKGRNWYTGEGKNIAATIILYPKCKIEKLNNLTIEIAEKIKEAIYELYGYRFEIKQPNDLIFNGKKICGILTEIHTQGNKIEYLLISFGFNVNEDRFDEETSNIATSLKKETGKEYSREDILIKIIEKLEEIEEIL